MVVKSYSSPYTLAPTMRMDRNLMHISTGLPDAMGYYRRVLATDPIAYWILGEAAGATAVDQIDSPAQDGTHTAVTLGQPGIGDGNTCPLYDGAASFTDVYSAAFAGVFDGDEGTIAMWARVANAGVWSDATARLALNFFALPSGDYIQFSKSAAANTFTMQRFAGGAADTVTVATTETDWVHFVFTWSRVADEVRGYVNGALHGAPVAGIAAWANALDASRTNIGCGNNAVPDFVYHGYIAHVAVWDRPLPPAEIASLYNNAPWVLAATYDIKVRSYSPIAYWPQWEGAGVTAYERINSPAQDGTYGGGMIFGQPGIGDGNTAIGFDGAADYNNVQSAALAAAFNGATGTVLVWARVVNAGVWIDGTNRIVFRLDVDGANLIYIRRETTNNVLEWRYRGPTRVKAGLTTTAWMCLALTWTGGNAQAYYNGVAEGAALAGGVWAGVPVNVMIGAANVAPAAVWNGDIAHCAIFDRALIPAEVADLYVVP